MAVTQEHMFSVTASVGGVPIPGVFDSFEGGEVTSESSPYHPGGMAEPIALPAPPSTGEVTIARGFDAVRDSPIIRDLISKVGQAAVVGKQALDQTKRAVPGGLQTYTGVLTGVTSPSHASDGTDVTQFELTFAISGTPS